MSSKVITGSELKSVALMVSGFPNVKKRYILHLGSPKLIMCTTCRLLDKVVLTTAPLSTSTTPTIILLTEDEITWRIFHDYWITVSPFFKQKDIEDNARNRECTFLL